MSDISRALFFSPYGQWHYHGACETTMAHALAARGVDVRFVACDGLFPTCDVFREATSPRTPLSCLSCQKTTASLYDGMATHYEWLGRHVTPGIEREIESWVDSLEDGELLDAHYRGYPVGNWIRSSVHFHYRASRIDLTDKTLAAGARDHLAGCALAINGLENAFDRFCPELLVLLNGRFFSHWAAIELALARGIRVVTHERGMRAGTLRFAENSRVHDLSLFEEISSLWGDVPLSRNELLWTEALLDDRRFGRGIPYLRYSPLPEPEADVRSKLALDDRPVVVAFTSSDDECAAFDERNAGAFRDSLHWFEETVRLGATLPHAQIVVRLHPNLTKEGTNRQTLELAERLRRDAPDNVRIVDPDEEVSSYTLADLAALGVVFSSTLGLEMAASGQPVVTVARGWFGHCPFVTSLDDATQYAAVAAANLARPPARETARHAFRFAFRYYRELGRPFPWVKEEPRHAGTLTYDHTDALAPGCDPELDALCEILLGERPLVAPPTPAEQARTTSEEDAFFADWFGGV